MKHEVFPADLPCTRDHAARTEVILLCEIRQGTRPWIKARLEDISPQGFRIAWLPHCSPDLPLRIRIPGMQPLKAVIRWYEGKAVGCAFAEPLHVAVYEHLVRQAGAQPA